MTGDDLRTAITAACSLTNPRLSEVEWDDVAAALAASLSPEGLDAELRRLRKIEVMAYRVAFDKHYEAEMEFDMDDLRAALRTPEETP